MNKIWNALIILGIVAFVSCTSRNKELTLLKVTELGSAKISDSAIVALLQREIGEKTRITYDLSEDKVLNSLRNRSVDMAIIPNNTIINDPKLEVRTILPLLPRILVIMDHNIPGSYGSNIKELFENNTIVYEAMSRMDSIFFKIFFRSFGIDSNKISSVIAQGIDLNEWADSSFLFVGLTHLHNPLMQKLIDQGANFVSLDKVSQLGKGSSVEGFKISFQSSYPFVLPKSFYKGKPDSPVLTIAIDDILVGLSDLDNTLVYNIVKTLIEDKAQLVQFDNIYNMLKTDFDAESFTFPLHAGTEQYISRDKPSIWTRYASLLWPFISIIAIIGSAFASFRRRMIMRRKQRIETFYQALLDIRKKAIDEKKNKNIEKLVQEMRKLRSKAFNELLKNKLITDESFNIFLSLYNEVKEEVMEELK